MQERLHDCSSQVSSRMVSNSGRRFPAARSATRCSGRRFPAARSATRCSGRRFPAEVSNQVLRPKVSCRKVSNQVLRPKVSCRKVSNQVLRPKVSCRNSPCICKHYPHRLQVHVNIRHSPRQHRVSVIPRFFSTVRAQRQKVSATSSKLCR